MSILLRHPPMNKGIVKNGLVLWLDGKDFSNNPPTTTWRDKSGQGNNATPSNFNYISNLPSAITSDFTGKVSGSVVVNPNLSKVTANSIASGLETLLLPSSYIWMESGQGNCDRLLSLNSICISSSQSVNGQIPQQLFSFDLISIVERQYGKPIPTTDGTIASKVAWLKSNISQITCNWYGYGSCPSGNKAYLKEFYNNIWNGIETNATTTPTKLSVTLGSILDRLIQNDGFVYYVAYTDSSDGVTQSAIYTDFVNLTINFKEASSGSDNQGGVVFDGVDDAINVPDNSLTRVNAELTVETKFKLNTSFWMGLYPIVTKSYATGNFEYLLGIDTDLMIRACVCSSTWNAGANFDLRNPVAIATGIDYHVILRYVKDGYTDLFINGVKACSIPSNTYYPTTTSPISIGVLRGNIFGGKIYFVRQYKKALTDKEIMQNYNSSR